MRKKLSYTILTLAMAGGMALGTGGVASAAHCVEDGEPGFSYYGTEHVREGDKHQAEGNKDGGPHVASDGTRSQGASACREASGSPSERAPGQSE